MPIIASIHLGRAARVGIEMKRISRRLHASYDDTYPIVYTWHARIHTCWYWYKIGGRVVQTLTARHGTAPRACRRSLWCGRWRPERTWRDLQRCAVVPVGVDPAHAPVQSFIEVSENVKEDTVETEDIFRV